jgi:hypothetical protein
LTYSKPNRLCTHHTTFFIAIIEENIIAEGKALSYDILLLLAVAVRTDNENLSNYFQKRQPKYLAITVFLRPLPPPFYIYHGNVTHTCPLPGEKV